MLNGSSACGPDDIHLAVLKACSGAVAWPLYIIFHKSPNTGLLPDLWKTSSVIPLHKGGSQRDPFNYKPISLASVTSVHSLLSPEQFRFRGGKSTEDQLLLTYGGVGELVDSGKRIDMVFSLF